jgi:hypothetical protein
MSTANVDVFDGQHASHAVEGGLQLCAACSEEIKELFWTFYSARGP